MPIPIPRPRESGRQLTKGRYCVAIFSMIFMTQIEQINVIVNGLLIDGQQISRNEYLTGGFVTRNSVTRTQHLSKCTTGKSYYEIPESFPQLKMRKNVPLNGMGNNLFVSVDLLLVQAFSSSEGSSLSIAVFS